MAEKGNTTWVKVLEIKDNTEDKEGDGVEVAKELLVNGGNEGY